MFVSSLFRSMMILFLSLCRVIVVVLLEHILLQMVNTSILCVMVVEYWSGNGVKWMMRHGNGCRGLLIGRRIRMMKMRRKRRVRRIMRRVIVRRVI